MSDLFSPAASPDHALLEANRGSGEGLSGKGAGSPASEPGPARWQQELAQAIRTLDELWRYLGLPGKPDPAATAAATEFPVRVPRGYADLVDRSDPHCPILAQIVPAARETVQLPGEMIDPVGDLDARKGGGLLQKYTGRALLITTGACPIHCRYCFRRHFPYDDDALGGWSDDQLRKTFEQLAALDCQELILSGGDPLVLGNARLQSLIAHAAAVPGVKRLRLHSRTPVVLPSRVDAGLIQLLGASPLPVVLVLHANHPRELTAAVEAGCRALRQAGVTLLNQAVLLKGVNADVETQVALAERLFACGVLPYYLHQLDPVAGAGHFQVDDHSALTLEHRLRHRLPGYLLPRLVREVPGAASKLPLTVRHDPMQAQHAPAFTARSDLETT